MIDSFSVASTMKRFLGYTRDLHRDQPTTTAGAHQVHKIKFELIGSGGALAKTSDGALLGKQIDQMRWPRRCDRRDEKKGW